MASQTTPATARAHDHTLELQHERHESEGTTAHATARSAGSATARKGSRHSTGAAESSQARHEDTSTQPASWWPWKKMFSGGSSGGLAARTASLSLSGLGAPPYAAAPAGAQRGQQQQGVLHAVEGEQMPAGKTAAAVMMKQPISNSWQGLDTPTGTLFASFDSRAQDYTFTYNNGAADSVAGSDAVADMVTGMHPPAPARSAFSTAMQRPVGKGQCGAAVGGTCGMSEGMDPGVHHAGSMPAGNRTSHRICNRIGSLRGTLKSPKASRSATQEGVMHTPPVHVKGDAGSMERSSQAKAMPAGSAGVLPVTRGSVQDGSISWSGAAACTHRAE